MMQGSLQLTAKKIPKKEMSSLGDRHSEYNDRYSTSRFVCVAGVLISGL